MSVYMRFEHFLLYLYSIFLSFFIQSNSIYHLREAHYLFYLFRGSLFDIWVKCKIYENILLQVWYHLDENIKNRDRERERERGLRVLKEKEKKNWRVRSAYCFENLTLRLFHSSQIHSSWFIHFLYTVVYTTNTIIIKIWKFCVQVWYIGG